MTDFGCTTAMQEKPRLLFYATREEIVSALKSAPEEVRYSILVETCPDYAYAAAVKRAEKAEAERDQALEKAAFLESERDAAMRSVADQTRLLEKFRISVRAAIGAGSGEVVLDAAHRVIRERDQAKAEAERLTKERQTELETVVEERESERHRAEKAEAQVERMKFDLTYAQALARRPPLSITIPTDAAAERIVAAIEKAAAEDQEPELAFGSRLDGTSVIDAAGNRVFAESGFLQCRNQHGDPCVPHIHDARAVIWRHDHAPKDGK